MHKHLELIKTLQPQVATEEAGFSDMEIILTQAFLMDAGSSTFKAFSSPETADVLAGLVSLSYTALQVFAMQHKDIIENKGEGYQIYQKLSIMQFISAKIHLASSGEAERYAELYYTCANLASGYLNADFDKAFTLYHQWRVDDLNSGNKTAAKFPDLTDCLYE